MRSLAVFERSLGQLITPQPSSRICRSCRLQGFSAAQRRQIQSSAQRQAGIRDLFRTTKKDQHVEQEAEQAEVATIEEGQAEPELPAGWSKSPSEDPNYMEATTWDNLERVGSDAWVEDQLDSYDNYEGWKPVIKNAKLEKKEAEELLLPIAKKVIKNFQATEGREWLGSKLTDARTKFQIARSLQEEAGIRLSDYSLNSAATLRDIRSLLLVKPEPKKLAEKLREEEQIQELANVKVHSRRVTPIDKEKAVGRWKIIEQALMDRGLPVTGHSKRVKKVESA